jgi:uncharacterized protein (TIGR00645 family)
MIERFVERLFFASRWLVAPVYLGLSIALIVLGIKFFAELFHVFGHVMELSESDVVLSLLALVDLSLVAGLIVMVMFSGYENFVSKIDLGEAGAEKLGWLGKLDATTLKLKVAASIVAISSIHLLRKFMEVQKIMEEGAEKGVSGDSQLMWYVIIHMTFVLSAVLMGVLDRISSGSKRDH